MGYGKGAVEMSERIGILRAAGATEDGVMGDHAPNDSGKVGGISLRFRVP